jgi:hypothetical protein
MRNYQPQTIGWSITMLRMQNPMVVQLSIKLICRNSIIGRMCSNGLFGWLSRDGKQFEEEYGHENGCNNCIARPVGIRSVAACNE